MIFELGKEYIVDVTEKGIIPVMVFDKDRWFDKDHDDLDFLTDKEKTIIVNDMLDKIRAEIQKLQKMCDKNDLNLMAQYSAFGMVLDILDKYKAESEETDERG